MLIKRMVRRNKQDVEEKLAPKRGAEEKFLVEDTLFEIHMMFKYIYLSACNQF